MRVPQEPGRQAGTPGTFASADGTTRKTRGGCGVPATNWSPADTMIGTHIAGEKKHTPGTGRSPSMHLFGVHRQSEADWNQYVAQLVLEQD